MLNLPVSEFMCDHPIKVKPDVSIRNAAHLLLRYRINGILVVSAEDPDKLIGIFTTTDLLRIMGDSMKGARKIEALNKLSDKPVTAFMSGVTAKLQKDDSAVKAVAMMHKKNALTIPVYDGNRLVGVIGRHDVINIAFA